MMEGFKNKVLLIPEKKDIERTAVAQVWEENEGRVISIGRFWEPPSLDPSTVCLYGNDTFCLILADLLGLHLISPPDDLLLHIDEKWLGRSIRQCNLNKADELSFPIFIKSLIPKVFRARVYKSIEELHTESVGLNAETSVMASDIVEFIAEVRAFVVNNQISTYALYEGEGNLETAYTFLLDFVEHNSLPKTCVIDVGCLASGKWVLIEANATWGAGLNGCDPVKAAQCIAKATTVSGL